jgi:ABC-type antimicrobial peptide transport system permease subunit
VGLAALRIRFERRQFRVWLGAIVLLALAGGAALTAAQAARRTDTAFARDLADGRASDAVVNANTYTENPEDSVKLRAQGMRMLDQVSGLQYVVGHGRFGGVFLARQLPDRRFDQRLNTGTALGLVAYDDNIGHTIARYRMEAGRPPNSDRADEVLINPTIARLEGWKVGTRIDDMYAFNPDDFDETGAPRYGAGPKAPLVVVGIGVIPEDLLVAGAERTPRLYLSPAFATRYPDSVFYLNEWVRLRDGAAGIERLQSDVTRINRVAPYIAMPISPTGEGLKKVNRANDPLVNGLWILAALAGIVGLLLASQSLSRAFAGRAGDHAQLRALGATRRQRLEMEAMSLIVVALVAAFAAAVFGFFGSALTPVGAAREAEPHPGLSVNLALMAIGVGLLFLGTVLATLPAIWRVSRITALPGPVAVDSMQRRARVADALASAGFGAPAVVGTRLALQSGRGATATPVRSVLASLTIVIAAATATFAFGVNLQRVTTTPRLYGWNWDAAVGSTFGSIPKEAIDPVVHFTNVRQAGGLTIGKITIGGRTISAFGLDPLRDAVGPDLAKGRLPQSRDEIVLGARTMRAAHARVGSEVNAIVNGSRVRLHVVGQAPFASFGSVKFNDTGLGTGALGTTSLFPVTDDGTGGKFNYVLVRFAPGTRAETLPKLRAWLASIGCSDPSCVVTDGRPVEIDGYRNAHGLPTAIGVVLVLLLVATLTHVLVTTMRRRSADLAVLRALGCVPRQLASILRWQALVLTGTALALGIPIGLVASGFAWRAFTNQLGIAPGTVVPLVALTILTLVMFLLALALASAAGVRVPRVARRVRLVA